MNITRLNKLHRIEYPDAEHIFISIAVLARYANNGTSPFVGIPLVTDGSRGPAIFQRKILQTALEAPGHIKAEYERHKAKLTVSVPGSRRYDMERAELSDLPVLTINGGKSCYKLIDQGSRYSRSELVSSLMDWAANKRKSLEVKQWKQRYGGPQYKKITDTRKQIVRLEKQLLKVHCRRPANPVVREVRESASESYRNYYARYIAEKSIRKALSKFIAGGEKTGTWAAFNAKLAEIVGSPITPFTVLKARKGGPDWIDYWKGLPKYTRMTRNPWQLNDWEKHEFTGCNEPDCTEVHGLCQIKQARAAYLASARLQRELRDNIAALKLQLAELETAVAA